jgi:hypothetical protein
MVVVLGSYVASIALADPCRGLGVGKDPGSSVAITTVVRPIAGPALPLRLELLGDQPRLVAGPLEVGAPATGVPGVFAFDGGTRASWMPATSEEVRTIPRGTVVFLLDGEQLEMLGSRAVVAIVLPLDEGKELSVRPEKDNQKTLQAGARCVQSRVGG